MNQAVTLRLLQNNGSEKAFSKFLSPMNRCGTGIRIW